MAKLPDTDRKKIQSGYGIVFLLDWNNLAPAGEGREGGRKTKPRALMGSVHF